MHTYLPGPHSIAFPLKTFDGVLDGLVTLTRLAHVPSDARRFTRVRDVGSGMDQVAQASSGEPVTAVLDRVGRSDEGQVLVIDGGRLVGLLSPTDITRALAASSR